MCVALCVSLQTVCKLLTLFPDQLYSQLLDWLSRLARSVKVCVCVYVCVCVGV